jgi:hypothetical protein
LSGEYYSIVILLQPKFQLEEFLQTRNFYKKISLKIQKKETNWRPWQGPTTEFAAAEGGGGGGEPHCMHPFQFDA